MARIPFTQLPDDARVWVFGVSDSLDADRSAALLQQVDAYLDGWQAHGHPLTCGRDWREGRFLVIGVDERSAGASGCSIDALFRVLQQLQPSIGATIVGGGNVFYRDAGGAIQCTTRPEFARLRSAGIIADSTPVYDTSVSSNADYRSGFEVRVDQSWHQALR